MRLRGLATRRWHSEKRLISSLCEGESGEPIRHAKPSEQWPDQPSKPAEADASKLSPAGEAKPAHTHGAPVPCLQPGEEIGYGYEIAPGVFVDAKPPVLPSNGLAVAAEAAARFRQTARRWNGEPRYAGPKWAAFRKV